MNEATLQLALAVAVLWGLLGLFDALSSSCEVRRWRGIGNVCLATALALTLSARRHEVLGLDPLVWLLVGGIAVAWVRHWGALLHHPPSRTGSEADCSEAH